MTSEFEIAYSTTSCRVGRLPLKYCLSALVHPPPSDNHSESSTVVERLDLDIRLRTSSSGPRLRASLGLGNAQISWVGLRKKQRDEKRAGDRRDDEEIAYNSKETYSTPQDVLNSTYTHRKRVLSPQRSIPYHQRLYYST
jgi:hypothetical protein